jgi:large subunit ribosomal protein L35e
MSTHLKIADARAKSKDDLLKSLKDCKSELSQLRATKQSQSAASKVAKIRVLRKNVARILTVLSTKERDTLKKLYAKKPSAMPKNLRPKLTKSRRLALTKSEKSRKTSRAGKKAAKYPMRKFAVKL